MPRYTKSGQTYIQDTYNHDRTLIHRTLTVSHRGHAVEAGKQEEGKWSGRLIQHLSSCCRWEGMAENLHLPSDLL